MFSLLDSNPDGAADEVGSWEPGRTDAVEWDRQDGAGWGKMEWVGANGAG